MNNNRFIPNSFQVPNAIIDEVMADLSGSELKCYLAILRKTKGWGKESDAISVTQLMDVTGLSNRAVIDACNRLVELNLICQDSGARGVKIFSVNLCNNFTSEKSSPVKKVHSTSEKSSLVTSEKSSHTEKQYKNTTKNTNISTSGKNSPTAKTKKYSYSPDDLKVAEWIFGLLRNLNPNIKEPTMANWANEIRLMRERDGKTHHEICELFKWANQNSFWRVNILSPTKLREKWDQLETKKEKGKKTKQESFTEKNSRNWATDEKMARAF